MSLTVLSSLPSTIEAPDVYYTDAFSELGEQIETGIAKRIVLAYHDENGSLHMQCLIRPIGDGQFRDITSAYGYGGPLLRGRPDTSRFVNELTKWAISEQIVSAFIRFDPIQANHRAFSSHTKLVSKIVLVPTVDEKQILNNLSSRYRKQYRRAIREDMRTEIRADLDSSTLAEFRKHYEHSMDRVQAQRSYYFPDGFWAAVEENQNELGATISRTTLDGVVHATALRLSRGAYAYNFLSATSDAGRNSHATEFDKISFCLHSQRAGQRLVNFGGGVGGSGDSLLEHKKRFAPNLALAEFHISKLIFMPEVYKTLSGGNVDDDGPFPAYRFIKTPSN